MPILRPLYTAIWTCPTNSIVCCDEASGLQVAIRRGRSIASWNILYCVGYLPAL